MIFDKDGNVVRNEDGTPLGSVDVNELPTPEPEDDLSSLTKAELVERAEAAGAKTSGLNKADLVALLEADAAVETVEPEGGDSGDDGVS